LPVGTEDLRRIDIQLALRGNISFCQKYRLEDLMNALLNIWQDDQGQDVAEYALMLAVILVVVVASVKAIGTAANSVFTKVGTALN
jgi:Flp pilus assembly pilin Flp